MNSRGQGDVEEGEVRPIVQRTGANEERPPASIAREGPFEEIDESRDL